MTSLMASLPFLAHTLIGFYFVFFGVWNIYHWFTIIEAMTERGIPHPYLILWIVIAWQTIAGILIIINIFSNIAAISLIPFTLLAACFLHPFWKCPTSVQRKHNMAMFVTQITITLGALLLLIACGSSQAVILASV